MLLLAATFITTVVSLLVALLVLLRNPRVLLYRWLFLFLYSASLWAIVVNLQGAVDPDAGIWLLRIAFASAALLGYSMIRFAVSLCRDPYATHWRLTDALILTVSIALSFTPFVISDFYQSTGAMYFISERGSIYWIVIVLIVGQVIRSLFIVNHYRILSRGHKRAQLNLIFAGVLAGTFIAITTNVVLPNITDSTYPSRFAFMSIGLWAFVLLYAIRRHRFLDVRWAAARTIAYTLSIAIVVGLYVLGVFVLANWVAKDPNDIILRVYYIVAAILAAVSVQPAKSIFNRLTDRLFFKSAYDVQETLDKLGDILADTSAVNRIMSKSVELIDRTLEPRQLHLVALGRSGEKKVVSFGGEQVDSELMHLFKDVKQDILIIDQYDATPSRIQSELSKRGVSVVIVMRTSKELVGYMAVGYKQSGLLFNKKDIDLLRLSAGQIAIALENALRFEEIQKFNKTLQEKIDDATRQLRQKNERLRMLDQTKDDFISMASHQLRTPLTSVKGYVSMVLDGDAGRVNQLQRKLLNQSYISSQRMVYLISDLLNVSRLRTGKFELEEIPTDLAKIIEEEVSQLKETAQARNLKLTYTKPDAFPVCMLDETKLRQVIMNFIDNAIYYTPSGGSIDVKLTDNEKSVELTVKDTGIGVPRRDVPHMFSKYFRARNAKVARPDGTGLGLFMAKKVVVAHGGAVIFKTREGHGSTFGFSLPKSALKAIPKSSARNTKA